MHRLILASLLLYPLQALYAATPVTTQTIQALAVYPELTAPATVLALNDSKLSAEVSARILEIPVTAGQTVEHGTVLVKLDARDFQTAVQRAEGELHVTEARRTLAQNQLRRAEQMMKKNFISTELLNQRQSELAAYTAELAVRQAQLTEARDRLGKTTLRAPFKAIIKERLGQVGELASPGTPLLRVLDAEHIEVSAQLQIADVASLKAAQQPVLVIQAQRFPLRLTAITPAVDKREQSQQARLHITGSAALTGAEGQVVWNSGTPHLPPELLVRRDGKLGVLIVHDAHAKFVPLPGAQEGRPAPVTLAPDTPIIVEGRFSIQQGAAVAPR